MDPGTTSPATGLARDALGWLAATGRVYGLVWITAIGAPWICFRSYVVERDQTRAIGFAMAVIAAWLGLGALLGTAEHPVIGGRPTVSFLIWAALLVVVVAPVAIHLLAFVATLVLLVVTRDRAGVSETVQVLTFSMAPAVLLAIPVVEVQVAVALYGTVLLVYGLSVVHRTSLWRALLAAAVPAYLLFGIGLGADEAVVEVLRAWYII